MGRRRARIQPSGVAVADFMPVSARVAWAYLGALLATVGAGVLVVLADQAVVPALCGSGGLDDFAATCQLSLAISVGLVGFLVCLIPAFLMLKLDWWLWAAAVAGGGFLVAADAVTEWWWWLCAALVPAAAALTSAEWGRGRQFRRWQLVFLLVLDVAAGALLARWFLAG